MLRSCKTLTSHFYCVFCPCLCPVMRLDTGSLTLFPLTFLPLFISIASLSLSHNDTHVNFTLSIMCALFQSFCLCTNSHILHDLCIFSSLHFQGFHQHLSYCNTGKPINFHCQAKEFSSKVRIIVLFCYVLFPGVPEPLRPWIQQPLRSTLIDLNPPVTSWGKNETKSASKCSQGFKDYFIMVWGKGCSTLLQ